MDDSEPVIIQLKDVLEDQGYSILVARDGEEALEIMQYAIPDAIILDLMMPNVDGFEVLKSLRENKSTLHLPVLILTAREITKAELNFLKQNNVHQLIQKGDINRDALLDAIRRMVNSQGQPEFKRQKFLQSDAEKLIVLIVEDNPDSILAVKAVLADAFTVLEATDGEAGVKIAKESKPHLILMDIGLPKLDGISAFKEIRSDTRLQNIPVIALTASVMTEERETILAYGFDGFISKPFDPDEFKHTIQQVLYGKN